MPNPTADLDQYKIGVDNDVTTKTTINSISPVEVGAIGTDLADLLLPYLQSINNQAYSQGTGVPSNLVGADLDLYYQQLVSGFSLWRKENGIWVLKVTMIYSPIEDGIITGLRTFIDGDTVTVTSGSWAINNTRYSKATQTQFTAPAPDANYLRYDLIYADDNNAVLYLQGTASVSPVYPATPADSIAVDYVVVPSVASGASPYLLSGGENSGTLPPVTGTIDAIGEADLSAFDIPSFPAVTVYVGGIQQPIQYDNTNKKLIGGNPGDAFVARFAI